MKGVTGRTFAPQNPRVLIQNVFAGDASELSDSQRTEALAVVGVGMVTQNQSPAFARGEVRDVFFAPPGIVDDEAQVETVSRSTATFKIGGKKLLLPDLLGGDIAPLAAITVSGVEDGYGFQGATDKNLSGYPADRNAEWSSGQKEGATLRLTWKTPQKIDGIALYDRTNLNDNATRSELRFSDGTSLEIGALPNDGQTPGDARFSAKVVEWVEWKALNVSKETEHIGLSEIAVFAAP